MSEQIAAFRPDRDAFGHMLLDHLNGERADEIIEREDGFIVTGDAGRYFAEYSAWRPEEQEAMRWLVPGRALDLGCGAGRVALHLQEEGHEVVAIDVSPGAVEVCRRRGVKDVRRLSITQVGPALGVFDNLLLLGNNWGLMANRGRARWLLRRFHRLTAPGARILAASNDPYQTESPYHLAYQALNRKQGRMAGQIRMPGTRAAGGRYLVHRSEWFDYLMVSRDEMAEIAAGTGWRVVRFLNSTGPAYVGVLEKIDRRG